MAIKIKKQKAEEAEVEVLLDEPDQVLAATQETFGWLQENRNMVIGALGVLVVGIIVGSLMWESRSAGKVETAAPLLQALATANAPIGAENGQFATERDRASATSAALPSGGDSFVLDVLTGSTQLALGDAATAATAFGAANGAIDGPERVAVAFGLAAAQAESGNLDAAIGTLESLSDTDAAPAAALQIARLTDTFGTPEQALTAYRGFLSANPAGPGTGDVANRVVQLELALGVDPVEVAPTEEADAEPSEG